MNAAAPGTTATPNDSDMSNDTTTISAPDPIPMSSDAIPHSSGSPASATMPEEKSKETIRQEKKLKKQQRKAAAAKKGQDVNPSAEIPSMEQVMEQQPTINIGTIGHVAHGKSTLTRAATGKRTGTSKDELERNMTIRLGYANAKIWKCDNKLCPAPWCYQATGSKVKKPPCKRPKCQGFGVLVRHVSFVDSPGHHDLMATMLSGAAVMDAAILVVAANDGVAPQTEEHLAAAEMLGIARNTIVCQNKMDLVDVSQAHDSYMQIKNLLYGTSAQDAPIIPVAAEMGLNVDVLCEYLHKHVPTPKRDLESAFHMPIVRTFDVNKPGSAVKDLKGGVVGGSLTRGVLRLGDEVEIRPGIVRMQGGNFHVTPLVSKVGSLLSEQQSLKQAVPGGLIAIGLDLDPCLFKSNRLVGQVLGAVGSLPGVFRTCTLKYKLMTRVFGSPDEDEEDSKTADAAKESQELSYISADAEPEADPLAGTEDTDIDDVASVSGSVSSGITSSTATNGSSNKSKSRKKQVASLKKKEVMLFCIGSSRHEGMVTKAKNKRCCVELDAPVCAEIGSKIAIFRNSTPDRREKHWRLVGSGVLESCEELPLHSASDPLVAALDNTDGVVEEEEEDVASAAIPEVAELKQGEEPEEDEEVVQPGKVDPRDTCNRFYEKEHPEVGEIVMVHVDSIDDNGVHVSLLEYDNCEAMISMRELDRKRIRSIKQVIRVNEQLPCCVLQAQHGHLDLSKKDISREEAKQCSDWYKQSRVLHSMLARVASSCNVPLRYLLEQFAWPLYDICEELSEESEVSVHPLDILKQVAHVISHAHAQGTMETNAKLPRSFVPPESSRLSAILGPGSLCNTLVEPVRAELLKNLCHRLSSKPTRLRAEVEVSCFAPSGCVVVKTALLEAVKQHEARVAKDPLKDTDEEAEPLRVYQESAPKYILTMSSRNAHESVLAMRQVCDDIKNSIASKGGYFRLALAPMQQAHI